VVFTVKSYRFVIFALVTHTVASDYN